MPAPVDLAAVLATFAEPWQPRTVATPDDYDPRQPGRADRRAPG